MSRKMACIVVLCIVGRFRLGVRKKFFIQRVVGYWYRLPREGVTAQSLTEFKKHSGKALRYMV